MDKLSDYLTVQQAAAYLGVSKDTLRRWDRSKKLPARRPPITNFRLYLKGDLDPVLRGVGTPHIPRSSPRKSKKMAVMQSE